MPQRSGGEIPFADGAGRDARRRRLDMEVDDS